MFNDPRAVLALIPPEARVLDVGGAVEVFPRADAVVDVQAYEDRGPSLLPDVAERFGPDTWHVGDVCAPEVWRRLGDAEFDFVLCSHTLEDVRDPIFLCAQLVRVAKAGYLECPSRFRECAKGSPDDAVAGWDHHRWIVDVEDGTVVFTPKMQWAHAFDYLGPRRRHLLHHHHLQFVAVHWTGSFDYVERFPKGAPIESENLFHFYDTLDPAAVRPVHRIADVPHRGRTFEWVTEFLLPVERTLSPEDLLARHRRRTRRGVASRLRRLVVGGRPR